MKIVVFKNLLWACLLIIAINLMAGYFVYKSNQQVRVAEQLVAHTHQVIYKAENILSAAKDIESALRAFILANDSAYLAPLLNAAQYAFSYIAELKQLTSDNHAQQLRVDSLGIYIQKRLLFSQEAISMRSHAGLEATIAFMTSKKDRLYSDQVLNTIIEIKQDEYLLLTERRLSNEKLIIGFNLLLEGLLILMSVLTVALMFVSGNYLLQNKGKGRRAAELVIANKELAYQNHEKENRATELMVANMELAFQNTEKEQRAKEFIIANRELSFQNHEKEERAAELIIANIKLAFQNKEKEDRAQELIIANGELSFQNSEKEKRAAELVIANNQLAFESVEKEKRRDELEVANIELIFQNEEKNKHAAELIKSNTDLNKAKAKITDISRLYELIGKLNENIVRVKNVDMLFKNSCKIVMDLGKYKTVWIGLLDQENKMISLVEQCGLAVADVPLFSKVQYQENDSHDHVIKSGKYYISNNLQQDLKMEKWKRFGETRGIHSLMMLPVKKFGKVVGTLNLYSAELVFADADEIELLVRVAEDISFALDLFENAAIQKETELLLQQNEKRYRSLVEKAVDMITLINPEGRIVYASPAVTDVLMRSNSELLNTCAFDLIHPEDIAGLEKEIERILQTPGRYCFRQQRYLRSDGEWIWCEGYVTNLMQEPGIHALLFNFRDISEKKKIEEQMGFDRNNLNALINNTDDLMWSVDMDLKLISFNARFAETFMDKNGGSIANGDSVFPADYSPEKLLRFKQLYDRALNDGESFTETDYETIPEESWTEISFYPIYKEAAVVGTACYARNVTKAKIRKEELSNLSVDLSKRVKDLEQFAYIVSHNLRAPVANILGAASMLNDPRIKQEKKSGLSRGLNESVIKLDGVIRDLNHILKVKQEISEIKETIYFSELVENIKSSIKNLIDKDSISIQYDFSAINELISLKNYIYSIFYNLITNSIRYRRADLPCMIEIKSRLDKDKMVLTFTDNGMGIDLDKNRHQVFGLYKRFNDTINGKGVGLYMVKTQVETLSGTIAVESEVNAGATFIIEFKIQQ